MKIRPIHPYGPPVGKWKSHGTVAETFARARKLIQQQSENRSEQKVSPLNRAEVRNVFNPRRKQS